MTGSRRLPHVLVLLGLALMLVGALDPLEGSLVILPGAGLVAVGAGLARSPQRVITYWAFVLVAVGVQALWLLNAMGGLAVRSFWWTLVIVPYPVGWVMALASVVQLLLDQRALKSAA